VTSVGMGSTGSLPQLGSTGGSENGSTFHQTAVDIEEQSRVSFGSDTNDLGLTDQPKAELKMPNGYDVIAVRETLLSEAPFVSPGSKGFWRRMMDNKQFVDILKNGYHHILGCISDGGVIDEEILSDVEGSGLVEVISNNFADIYFGFSRHERDIFLPKLPEILVFMIINALQAAQPKHQRIYMSTMFREMMLDWSTELFGGFRQSKARTGREWLFDDCNETLQVCLCLILIPILILISRFQAKVKGI